MVAKSKSSYRGRLITISFFLSFAAMCLLGRMVQLTVYDKAFLEKQGNARILRTMSIPATRGMILDRNLEPLAISVPVDAVWLNPKEFSPTSQQLHHLASILHLPSARISRLASRNKKREFIYLRRGLDPAIAAEVLAFKIKGLYTRREYKRFYPEAQVASQVLGLTNIDDQGQEGLELAYNHWLHGIVGKKRVLKDRMGHIVADVDVIRQPKPGKNLVLSIDRRIQYLAYRDLQNAMHKYEAKSGSVVVLDAKTGEILAVANAPSFNPNNRPKISRGSYRNRALTDVFEPGSVIKAFTLLSALDSGKYTPETVIDTAPGWMEIDGNVVRDEHAHGEMSLTQILKRSSNVGVTKVTLSLAPEQLWGLLHRVGFGERTHSGFPGEAHGSLVNHQRWRPFALATLGFGYGISATPLQLAKAYGVIANHGSKIPVTFLKREQAVQGEPVIERLIADAMITMLKTVVEKGGTGTLAQVPGYQVAGKTGTARLVGEKGYSKYHHIATFVGMAPASDPRLVVAVMINDPHKVSYYGGLVAAPVFSHVMASSLRIMNVAADGIV